MSHLPGTEPLNEAVGVPGLGKRNADAKSLLAPLSILVSLSAPGVIAPGVLNPDTTPSGVNAPGVSAPACPGNVDLLSALSRLMDAGDGSAARPLVGDAAWSGERNSKIDE